MFYFVQIISIACLSITRNSLAFDYWIQEPVVDFSMNPRIARSVYFLHMRKAAGTSIRQYFLKAYQSLSCLPPSSGPMKSPEGRISEPLQIFSLGHFNSPRFITCLRHPVDRFISISWYDASY